jgi:hypothetical protein
MAPMSGAYPAEAHVRRTATLLVAALSLLFIVILAGLGDLLAAAMQRDVGSHFGPVVWITLGAWVVLLALIIPLTYLVRAAWWGRSLSRVRSGHPESESFLARATPELVEALQAVKLNRSRLPRQLIVTVDDQRLELRSRRSRAPLCVMDTSDSGMLLPGVLPVRMRRITIPVRAFFISGLVDGRQATIPLVPVGDHGIWFASAADANRFVDRIAKYLKLAPAP